MSPKIRRKHYLVDKDFQISFIIKFCVIVVLASLIIGAGIFYLTQNSTTVAIENTKVIVKSTADFILPVLVLTVAVVALFSSIVLSIMALFVSHRIVGPLYRLRKEINLLKGGDLTRPFLVRNKDHLKDLAKSLADMSWAFRKRHEELQNKSAQLRQFLQEKNYNIPLEDKERFTQIFEELDQSLKFFKI